MCGVKNASFGKSKKRRNVKALKDAKAPKATRATPDIA
jgi:hypothetical protein